MWKNISEDMFGVKYYSKIDKNFKNCISHIELDSTLL